MVLTAAVRDKGVSQHFVAPSRYAEPDAALTARLDEAIRARGGEPLAGKTWTTAVPFRITPRELAEYAAEGVVTTELEAAALFAVARARDARSASAVVVTDITTPAGRVREDWRAAATPLLVLLEAAAETLQ